MTQEDKDLLLKDLCARLPYHTNLYSEYADDNWAILTPVVYAHTANCSPDEIGIKPYLFPISSMTDEQEKELSKLGVSYGEYALHDDIRGLGIMVDEAYIFFEFCYKHHIDFLGLIEMGLAIDATGKNIY